MNREPDAGHPKQGASKSRPASTRSSKARLFKAKPSYAIASVDHALRVATMLQLEGAMTVTEVAARLGVARSTAHRILAMLVYRDFAVQLGDLSYAAGPVLELSAYSPSHAARIREVGLPHLTHLANRHRETVHLVIRTGATIRFILSVESNQMLRVGTREGMVLPAHHTAGGLLLLSELSNADLAELYAGEHAFNEVGRDVDLAALHRDVARVRKVGFAVNVGRAEQGIVAVGVPIRSRDGSMVAGMSMSLPIVRYDRNRLDRYVGVLRAAAARFETDLSDD